MATSRDNLYTVNILLKAGKEAVKQNLYSVKIELGGIL
jgi:hypothetical protein